MWQKLHDPVVDCQAADDGMTHQSFQDECDINKIMKRYQDTGMIEHVREISTNYGDFSNVDDYQTALNKVISAQESFDALPAEIRKRFKNDPAELIDFMNDPKNAQEAVQLGLLENLRDAKTNAPLIPVTDEKTASPAAVEKAP